MAERYQNLDIDGSARRADPHAMLLADLADFVTRHRLCGQLTGDATEPAPEATRSMCLRGLPTDEPASGSDDREEKRRQDEEQSDRAQHRVHLASEGVLHRVVVAVESATGLEGRERR